MLNLACRQTGLIQHLFFCTEIPKQACLPTNWLVNPARQVRNDSSRSIGKSTAELYSREGANADLSDIDEKKGNNAAEEINKNGGNAVCVCKCTGLFAAKRGVVGITQNAAVEYAKKNIRVNSYNIDFK